VNLDLRVLTGRILAVATLGAIFLTGAAPAASAAGAKLTVTRLAFSPRTVDASSGGAVVNLAWTVKDSSGTATSITGDVKIRMEGPQSGTYVGITYDVPFSLTGGTPGLTTSGTAQNSSYSYAFTVPQYGFATMAHWDVTQVVVQDDQHDNLNLSGNDLNKYSNTLAATVLADPAPPTYDSLGFPVAGGPARPYVFNGGSGGSSSYFFNADDAQSGFWKGVITLAGPDGQTLSTSFSNIYSIDNQIGSCGAGIVFDDTSAQCQPSVTIPPTAASGTWAVSKLELWDNAGNHATFKSLNALPITVTDNSVVQASGFAANPTQVDNWVQTATSNISMAVTGATGGVSTVFIDFMPGDPCRQQTTTPTLNSDGSYTVPVSVFSIASSCTVDGIAVIDGAGDVSVYGAEYGEPDLGVTLTRVPDTTPPVATSASLSPTTLTQSPNSGFVDLTVNVADAVAPVVGTGETIFDSSGNIVGGGDGGVIATLNGPVVASVPVPANLAPGTYTVAFSITDAGDLTTFYGYPAKPPVPGGPLTFTVVP
jgi:hypothetical protein